MKTKKTDKKTVHDLRDLASVRVAIPDISDKLTGLSPLPATDELNIVSPSIGNEPLGQGTHD